ncbi:MAG TPA: DUF4178 domain-containing protein [Kofleriaceae bacterium]|nr:DUF4178 domain-containing protein [Kofleriaceae bacterium]
MKTSCPNCGAEIEFRFDDSFVRICSHCNAAVQRTDRGLETLGKVADLTPIDSPLKLFSEGHFGNASFMLVGMAQIRHAQGGIWQEWYARFDSGRWGWLAEAQGRYYLTFVDPAWKPIDLRELAPGHVVDVPLRGAQHPFTVAEATSGSYISARGELPFKLVPNETFHYADLSDGKGAFATIDYGDGEDPPAIYVGVQVPLADLKLSGGEVAPPHTETITSKRLACPNCNAPIELRAAEQSQRAVCTHCNALLDLASPALAVLAVLKQRPQLAIPLGSKGTFVDGELAVIGYLQRSAYVDGSWWPFEEYLLYRQDLGFRWLVESDGHWSYVQPIASGAVDSGAIAPVYDKIKFRHFQNAELRVDQVLGEVYWQVNVGETVSSDDYVAPPAMLSREVSPTEEDWSLSSYMTPHEVEQAFHGTPVELPHPDGIAPNQPDAWTSASSVMSIAFLLLLLAGIVFSIAAKDDRKLDQDLTFTTQAPASAGSAEPPSAPGVAPLAELTPEAAAVPECRELRVLVQALDTCPDFAGKMHAVYDPILKLGSDGVQEICKATADSLDALFGPSCAKPDVTNALLGVGSGSAAPGSDATGSVATGSDAPEPNVIFSDPFQLDGGQNVALIFRAPSLDNNWVYIASDLVDQATGEVVNLETNLEYYSGIDDGDSWSEGSRDDTLHIGPQPAGTYLIRFEGQSGPLRSEHVHVEVRQGVFRFGNLALAMFVLGLPLSIVGLISYLHEKRRWENSSAGKPPFTPIGLIVLMFGGVFLLIGAILKAFASRSDD